MYQVLYNPLSANGQGYERALELKKILNEQETIFTDVRTVTDFDAFFKNMAKDDALVIAGGDGTLNKFVNLTDGIELPEQAFYYAAGSGNDFKHDVAPDETGLIPVKKYIENLPIVTVKGKTYRFVNGIGYGIDGYCCEVGDKMIANRKEGDKPVNYAGIAIKGLLFHFKPANATVTVDGVTKSFKHVWLAPSMNGRYYGGGMMIAPDQQRLADDKKLTLVVMHGSGKIKTLVVFPSIFKGQHVKHTEMVEVMTGKEITVKFDAPIALQIDGETVLNVTEYSVKSVVPAKV